MFDYKEAVVLLGIAFILAIYGPRLSPQLPIFIRNAFNNGLFRFLVLTIIVFIGTRSIRVSLICAIVFMALISMTNKYNIQEDYRNQVQEYNANYNLFTNDEEHSE
jgi:hypothetical protein